MAHGTGHATSIAATRLRPRALPNGHVARPRLYDRFGLGHTKLTLVSAPAGAGKTTVVREWLARLPEGSWVWLSLDTGDNDAVSFWSGVIECVRQVHPSVGADARDRFLMPGSRHTDAIASLLDDLDDLEVAAPFVIVLEDLHRARAKEINDTLSHFVEHLPEHIHLVITSRVDPGLPLARMRASGDLAEIRADDLAFVDSEAVELIAGDPANHIDTSDVLALNQKTEGWVVGLRLAAAALRTSTDPRAFVQSFGGWEFSIAEFLLDEVLQQLDPATRRFLVDCSVVDSICPSLAEALTGRTDSGELLRTVANAQVFVERLEGDGQWYRYHQLVSDLLTAEVRAAGHDRWCALHRKASHWYDLHDRAADCIEHAIESGDEALTVDVLARRHTHLFVTGEGALVRRAVASISDEFVVADIRRALTFAEVLAFVGLAGPTVDLQFRIERLLPADDVQNAARLLLLRGITKAFAGDLGAGLDAVRAATERFGQLPFDDLALRARAEPGAFLTPGRASRRREPIRGGDHGFELGDAGAARCGGRGTRRDPTLPR